MRQTGCLIAVAVLLAGERAPAAGAPDAPLRVEAVARHYMRFMHSPKNTIEVARDGRIVSRDAARARAKKRTAIAPRRRTDRSPGDVTDASSAPVTDSYCSPVPGERPPWMPGEAGFGCAVKYSRLFEWVIFMNRSTSTTPLRVGLCAIVLALSFAGCNGGSATAIPPAAPVVKDSSAASAPTGAHRHTRISQPAPGDPTDPCLQDPISCGTGIGCDASQECGGIGYPPPSELGGGGGGGDVTVPAPSSPSNRPKTAAEKACNAAGGVFFTDTGGNTHCQKPGMVASVYGPTGCPLYLVLLNTNGTGGQVYFPPELLRDPVPFTFGGGVAFEPGCAFTVYNGYSN